MLRHSLLAAFALPLALAQEPPPPTGAEVLAVVRASCKQLRQGPNADAEAQLDAALAAIRRQPDLLDHDQMLAAGQALLRAHADDRAIGLMEVALGTATDPSGLLDVLGLAHHALATAARTDVQMRLHAGLAAKAFFAARSQARPTIPSHEFLWQVLLIDARFDEALVDYDQVAADPRFRERLPDRAITRSLLLTCAGRYAEALAIIDDPAAPAVVRAQNEHLAIRALALSGHADQAVARATLRWRASPGPVSLGLLAEALAADGKADAALELLHKHPVDRLAREPDAHILQRQRSRAALEYLLTLHDAPPADLRVQLAQRLGFTPTVVGPGDDDAARMAASPPFLVQAIRGAETGPTSWANDLLLLACLRDADTHRMSELEQKLTTTLVDDATRALFRDADAKARTLQILRGHLMLDDREGVVTALRLAAKL